MAMKRVKKIIKISALIGVKETWKLICHLYLMTYQPFLTLKLIKTKKDKSQLLLISATAMSPFLIYSMARIVFDYLRYGEILYSIGPVFLSITAIELLIFLFLGYWTIRVWREE